MRKSNADTRSRNMVVRCHIGIYICANHPNIDGRERVREVKELVYRHLMEISHSLAIVARKLKDDKKCSRESNFNGTQ